MVGIFCMAAATNAQVSDKGNTIVSPTNNETTVTTETPQIQQADVAIPKQIRTAEESTTNVDPGLDPRSDGFVSDQVNASADSDTEFDRATLPDDFPVMEYTGDKEADKMNYQLAKEEWIANNPERYQEILDQQVPSTDTERTPQFITNEQK